MNVAELSRGAEGLADIAGFQAGLRAWLDGHDLSPGPDRSLGGQVAQLTRVRRALWDAGWMRYGWPAEAGGLGGPALLRAVLGEEVASRDLAEPGIYSMVEVLAPTVISYARPPLAAEMVPRLLSGAEQWCQGFSEPGAGSDLASLSTRAEARGDDWVISGQKVWTSLAQYSARCVLLARTGPGHGGITAFFADMDAPGITVRPLRTMHGVDEFAEVFFDDVVVPGDRVLGRPGDGWRVATDLLPYERSTCFWHRIAYLYTRLDRLLASVSAPAAPGSGSAPGSTPAPDEAGALGAAYLALHTARCRSLLTQRRLAAGERLGPETSVDKVLLATAEQQLFDTVRDLLPGVLELTESPWRPEYLFSRAATIYGGTAEIQRNIIARRLLGLGEGMTLDATERDLLADTLRKTMTAASGRVLDLALVELGWPELLAEFPDVAIPVAFGLLGETGAHAPLLNDVLLHAAGHRPGGTVPMPYAGGSWVVWERCDLASQALDGELPLRPCPAPVLVAADAGALAAGRRALGWWLAGLGRAMLALARSHALDRAQFGRPLASFQAVRHRLAETMVALDGAEATLLAAGAGGDVSSMLAKAAAGQAALTAARHCQQVLGGIGFTAEHGLHRHIRRALVLDGLLGSARELTREAGLLLRQEGRAPRLVHLVTEGAFAAK